MRRITAQSTSPHAHCTKRQKTRSLARALTRTSGGPREKRKRVVSSLCAYAYNPKDKNRTYPTLIFRDPQRCGAAAAATTGQKAFFVRAYLFSLSVGCWRTYEGGREYKVSSRTGKRSERERESEGRNAAHDHKRALKSSGRLNSQTKRKIKGKVRARREREPTFHLSSSLFLLFIPHHRRQCVRTYTLRISFSPFIAAALSFRARTHYLTRLLRYIKEERERERERERESARVFTRLCDSYSRALSGEWCEYQKDRPDSVYTRVTYYTPRRERR